MARSLKAAIGSKLAAMAVMALVVGVGVRMGEVPHAAAPAAASTPVANPAKHVAEAVPAGKSAPFAGLPIRPITAVDEPFVIKRILDVPKPFRHGDYAWDDAGVPAGPLVITVDLAAQVLSVFRDGYEIGAAVILYGDVDKPTPLGVFPITQKDATHVSNLYDAPMPYMLRLTNDGVSIHGSKVDWNYATHGCIGVPMEFAKKLFGQAKLGDRVIITNGEKLDMGERIPAA
jgi:lipoprotein-anchoring transpeptidase ErfK/SrfK